MFGSGKAIPPTDTVVGEHTTFRGNIVSDGSVRIFGRLEGNLEAKGDIHIEVGAIVRGNLTGLSAYVAGQVEGDVSLKGVLHLQAKSHLTGSIEVAALVTDEGAVFQGGCRMLEPDASKAKKRPVAERGAKEASV